MATVVGGSSIGLLDAVLHIFPSQMFSKSDSFPLSHTSMYYYCRSWNIRGHKTQKKPISPHIHMHELTDRNDRLVSLWLIRREYANPPSVRFCTVCHSNLLKSLVFLTQQYHPENEQRKSNESVHKIKFGWSHTVLWVTRFNINC